MTNRGKAPRKPKPLLLPGSEYLSDPHADAYVTDQFGDEWYIQINECAIGGMELRTFLPWLLKAAEWIEWKNGEGK